MDSRVNISIWNAKLILDALPPWIPISSFMTREKSKHLSHCYSTETSDSAAFHHHLMFLSVTASHFPVDRRIRRNRWSPQVQVYRMFQGLQVQAPPEGAPAHSQRWAVLTATLASFKSCLWIHCTAKCLELFAVEFEVLMSCKLKKSLKNTSCIRI